MGREFRATTATRRAVPLLLGLVGPSGGGKTFSALRLATGIQRVTPGKIYMVDTENGRALHYADDFRFEHVPFGSPFSPLDYLAAIEFVAKQEPAVIIVDSASHEWEGPGGVLEFHDRECDRLMKEWRQSRGKVQLGAWARPKRDHRRLINTLLQIPCHFIFCFRAKRKLKIVKGKDPVDRGWQPITGGDLVYEFTANMLLPPAADGVPEWTPEEAGEREMLKRPGWATEILRAGCQLDEAVGEELARWAAGTRRRALDEVLADLEGAPTAGELGALKAELKGLWSGLDRDERGRATKAVEAATADRTPAEELNGELSEEGEAAMEAAERSG